jgi:hypothetical protein
MSASTAGSAARQFYVLWQFRSDQPWHSAGFDDREAAFDCFFRWMQRGVPVRWLSP